MSKIKDEIRNQIEEWDYFAELPNELEGFRLTIDQEIIDGFYRLFTYEDKSIHRKFFVIYNASLGEYHAQEEIGLNLFCQIDYITSDLAELKRMLHDSMATSLRKLRRFPQEELGTIFAEKGIATWDYIAELPQSILGFDLFVHPNSSIRIINGSFLILLAYKSRDKRVVKVRVIKATWLCKPYESMLGFLVYFCLSFWGGFFLRFMSSFFFSIILPII